MQIWYIHTFLLSYPFLYQTRNLKWSRYRSALRYSRRKQSWGTEVGSWRRLFCKKDAAGPSSLTAFCTEARFIYICKPRVLCNPPFYFLPSALNSYPSHDIRFCNHQNQIALSRFLLLMAIFVLTVLWDVWLSAIHSFEKGLGNFSNKQTTRTMRNERFKEPPQRVTLKITSKFIPRVHSDRAPKKSYVYKNKPRRWVETFVGVCVRLFFNHLHNIIWWRGSCDLW